MQKYSTHLGNKSTSNLSDQIYKKELTYDKKLVDVATLVQAVIVHMALLTIKRHFISIVGELIGNGFRTAEFNNTKTLENGAGCYSRNQPR